MPASVIRTSHLYLYDSTIGQSELTRENNVHCKLIMKAKSRINTQSPKFWIPHVGSPLRLTKPHAQRPSLKDAGSVNPQQGINPGKIRPQSAGMVRGASAGAATRSRPSSAGVRGSSSAFHHHSYMPAQEGAAARSRPQSAAKKRLPGNTQHSYGTGAGGQQGHGMDYLSEQTRPQQYQDSGLEEQDHNEGPAVYGSEAAADLRQASDVDLSAISGTQAPSGAGNVSGLSPFRDHGLQPSPKRRRSPLAGSRNKQRQNYQQMALQKALDKQALEEQQRREKFREEQTRGLTLMGAAAVARAEGTGRTVPPPTGTNTGGGTDQGEDSNRSIPTEYGGGGSRSISTSGPPPPPAQKLGALPQQHLTYHVEEVFHAHTASPTTSRPQGSNVSGVMDSMAATSQIKASELAAMRGGASGGPTQVQDMVEEFVHFCSTAFPHNPQGDDEVKRLLMHCTREIEERRLLALHRQRH